MKKRFLSLLAVIVAVLTATPAIASVASTTVDSGTVVREGHLTYSGMNDEEYSKFLSEVSDDNNGSYVWTDYGIDRPEYAPYLTRVPEPHGFDSLTEMIMALDADKIDCMELGRVVGEYFLRLKGNKDKYVLYMASTGVTYYLSMGFKEGSKGSEGSKWFEPFNEAIKEMKRDKTLLFLKAQYILNSTDAMNTAGTAGNDGGGSDNSSDNGSDNGNNAPSAASVKFDFFPNAETVKIAVTGDMPPLDYIAPDGRPAGFNTALLAEIGKRLKVNVELVNINTGARAAALASGRVDGVFWFQFENTSGMKGFDSMDGVKLTEPYYAEDVLFYIGKKRH